MFVMPAFHSSLLCMFAAHDAVGARQVGGAEMKKHRKVSGLVTGSKGKRSVVKLVAAVCIHTPLIWAPGHDEEPSALTVLLFQRTKPPQKRITRC